MGMFSWLCRGCEHPLLSHMATNEINSWMSRVVVLEPTGEMYIGEYDGYGRVGAAEIRDFDVECWHAACWTKAGKPMEYKESSRTAPDQGWFFDDGAHDIPCPT